MDFDLASRYIFDRLQRELKPALTYHCVDHTIDVLTAIRQLARLEKIDLYHKTLLETAALYHDAGMLVQYRDHESASMEIAKKTLPGFGYSESEIAEISELISVTKLPQRPYNHLEQILCDADLDYLGQDVFFINSFKLRLEWQLQGILQTTLSEWFDIQIKFLNEHHYFTNSAMLLRNEKKLKNLEEIKKLCRQDAQNRKS
jgi:uncharacterized protein